LEKIRIFLKEELNLDLSEAKTKVTNAKDEQAEFLSVRIRRSGRTTFTSHGNITRRNVKNLRLTAPIDKITTNLSTYGFMKEGNPYPKFL
jgi:hypothetical protein